MFPGFEKSACGNSSARIVEPLSIVFFITYLFGPAPCILDVFKAWDYVRTIFQSEKLRIAYIKAEKDTRKHIFDISKVRKSTSRGLLGRHNCLLSQ